MDWRKTSLVTGLLLLVALIGAITWTDSNGFSDESQYSSTTTRDIIQWTRNRAGFGTEFEYRTNGASVRGFTRRGPIGKLFTRYVSGRRPLRVFVMPSDTNVRMFSVGGPAPGYSKYIGIAGFCSSRRISGSTPFFQVSKASSVIKRVEYAYAAGTDSLNRLKQVGYGNQKLLCYIQAMARSVRIKKYERWVGSLRYYEYRKVGVAPPPGYRYRGVMPVVLASRPFSGSIAVRVYENPRTRDRQFYTRGPRKRFYTTFRGIAGYCSMTRRSSLYLPIYKYGRYLSTGYPRDNGYTVSSLMRREFIRRRFRPEGILCYARKA